MDLNKVIHESVMKDRLIKEQQSKITLLTKVVEAAKVAQFNATLNADGNYTVSGMAIGFLTNAIAELQPPTSDNKE